MMNHHERAYDLFNHKRSEAKALLEKHGVEAYEIILNRIASAQPRSHTRSTVDDAFYSDSTTQLLAAFTIEVLYSAMSSSSDPYSFTKVANSELMNRFHSLVYNAYKRFDSNLDERAFYSSTLTGCIQNWCYLIHHLAGNKTFEVSPHLAKQLLNTELRGLSSDDLRLPYQSVYVMIPPSDTPILKLFNEQTGWHSLEGFYLTEDPIGEDPLNPVRTWRFLFVGSAHKGSCRFDDALFHFSIELPTGISLDEALDREQSAVDESTLISDANAKEIFRREWRILFNWAMNVIMYSTWPEIETTHFMANDEARALWNRMQKLPKGSKKDDLKSRFKRLQPMNRIRLGRYGEVKEKESDLENTDRHTRHVRTLVSGFWMRQAYGENRSLRRWRYQPPYWRNRDSSIESNPIHVLV